MSLTSGYSKSTSKTVIAVTLLLLLGSQTAFGLPFLPKKKPAVENLPPSTRISPNLMQPAPVTEPGKPPSGQLAKPVAPPEPPPTPVQTLVKKGIFPEDAETRTTPFTRAELASILVKALGHNTQTVSEFPFYRDVPKDYWAYAYIEAAREKQLIEHAYGHGFYYPDKTVTYADAYLAISHAITGPPPTPEVTAHLLKPFKDKNTLKPYVAAAAAKMTLVRFFATRNLSETQKTMLRPNDPLDAEGLAPMITYLQRLIQRRSAVRTEATTAMPVLPAGLKLSVSPATAILEAKLTPGEYAYFTLPQPVDRLPKGSRFRGVVREAQPDNRKYTVELFEAQSPDGTLFQTSADLILSFPPKEKLGFFVPGELFETYTKSPANPEENEAETVAPSVTPAPNQPVPAIPEKPKVSKPTIKAPTKPAIPK